MDKHYALQPDTDTIEVKQVRPIFLFFDRVVCIDVLLLHVKLLQ